MASSDKIRLITAVDIDDYVRGGIGDFQGEPHLFLSECLDYDQPQRSRRYGETFFLAPVEPQAAAAFLRQYEPEVDRDPNSVWPLWLAFRDQSLTSASHIWRARGNFRQSARRPSVAFSWTLLTKKPIGIDVVRARLARTEEIERSCESHVTPTDDELPF